jgi:hypothetical protein
VTPATATTTTGIQPAKTDVGLNLAALPRDICLPSTDAAADITTSVPRAARLVSDVFNHAYQNSDYSPYSGQQPEAISRNLQASAIISMIPANQGELGQALLKQQKPAVAAFAANLRNKAKNLVQKYEGVTNKIIAQIGDKAMKDTATEGTNGVQKLATCFRCAEVGSVTTTRLTTNTYVPSFQLPANQVAAAKALVPAKYDGLISASGIVQIYQATLDDLAGEFAKAATMGLLYQPAIIKTSTTTMADQTQFKKVNAAGQRDNGVYAATQAQAVKKAAAANVSQKLNVGTSPLMSTLSADDADLPDIGTAAAVPMVDYHGVNKDSTCDDDKNPTDFCSEPDALFAAAADDGGLVVIESNPTGTEPATTAATISTGAIIGIAVGAGVLVLLIVGAVVVKYHRTKKSAVTTTTAMSKV